MRVKIITENGNGTTYGKNNWIMRTDIKTEHKKTCGLCTRVFNTIKERNKHTDLCSGDV